MPLPEGIYTFEFQAPGFARTILRHVPVRTVAVSLPVMELKLGNCGERASQPVLEVRMLNEPGTSGELRGSALLIRGRRKKAAPANGATVRLVCGLTNCPIVHTSPTGEFVIAGVKPGVYSVQVTYPGFYTEEAEGFEVCPRLSIVYAPVTLEGCSHGDCRPEKRPVKLSSCE